MSMVKANAAVRRGVNLLDGVAPGWWKPNKISLKRLDLTSLRNCVVGQLQEHNVPVAWQTGYGFVRFDLRYDHTYDELQVAWEREIRARREAAKAKA